MRPGTHVEAPTHLGSSQLGLPPEWLADEAASGNEIVTSAVRGGRAVQAAVQAAAHHSFSQQPMAAYPVPRVLTERSSSELPAAAPLARSDSQSERGAEAASEAARAARRAERKARKNLRRGEHSVVREHSVAAPVEMPARAPSQPVMEMGPGINAIDPLAIPVPPELGQTIYSWIRRLALQADLASADRVLRDALLDISSSLSCTIVYPGQDGLWTLGADDEIPREAQPLIAVATARRAVVSSHSAIIPVLTTSETVAVITMTRNPRNPAYHPIEQIAMIALAREAAAILHHLAVAHLAKQAEINHDKGGLYRGEALEAHRTRGNEGVPVHLTPGWVRRTYPFLGIAIVVAILASIFLTIPTYSTGSGVVMFDGTTVSAPAAGLVDTVHVQPGQQVKKGQVLVRLHGAQEAAELALAKEEWRIATQQYLLDNNDEQIKKTLASVSARIDRARAQLDTRIIRASKDGTVADTRVQSGKMLNAGDRILTIVAPGTEPEIICFLPGKDRPRLHKGMKVQVQLAGYTRTPDEVEITFVGTEVIGANEAARVVGAELADTLKQLQGGSFVIVKARLPSTFKTDRKTMRYHHGMLAQTEVKIQSKPFLVTLLPVLEKHLPDAE